MSCKKICGGPGYATPAEAIKGPKEKVLFITAPSAQPTKAPDALVTIDVDPQSKTYGKALCKLLMPNLGDEVHHMGWNICSSCHGSSEARRTHLVLPCLNSSRIYIIDATDPANLTITKVIEKSDLANFDVSFPHTAHCLANGNIMVSTLGDANDNNKCDFLLIDNKTFEPIGTWVKQNLTAEKELFGYDFWYQPSHNVMLSTEWGSPSKIFKGFNLDDVANGHYGNKINVFDWNENVLKQSITLKGPEGWMPLEVRFKHNPEDKNVFIGTALGSSLFHLWKPSEDSVEMKHRLAVSVPSKKVENWALPSMPGLITDIIISMDDNFIFFSNWLHGDIRMYDIRDPFDVKLVGQVFVGGSIHKETSVKVTEDSELKEQPDATYIKGEKIDGGPQMLQLSLDGKRLYVTTSLYRKWDEQFYPDLLEKGAKLLLVEVENDPKSASKNRLKLNKEFLFDFGKLFDNGIPYLAHEMRYPNGDCTSDIFLSTA